MGFPLFLIYIALAYVRPYELYPGLAPYRLMLVFGSIGLLVTLLSVPLTRFSFRARQVPLLILFALWASFSLVIANQWFGGALMAMNEMAVTLISFILAIFSVNSEKRLRISLMVLASLALILVFLDFLAMHFGIFQETLTLTQNLDQGGTRLRARATGFLKDPNDLAQCLLTAMPFVALAWRKASPIRNLLFAIIPMGFLLYGINMTASRGALVSLLAMAAIAVRPKIGNLLTGVAGAFGALCLLLISFGGRAFVSDESALGRLEAWSIGLQLLKHNPLSGVGFGNFTDHNPITAHNSFVLCFSELGLPGYFLWIALLLVTLLELNSLRKLPVVTQSDANLRRYARSIQISLYGFLLSSWFLSRTYVVTLYLLIALSISAVELGRRSGKWVEPVTYSGLALRTAVVMIASIVLIYAQVRLQIR